MEILDNPFRSTLQSPQASAFHHRRLSRRQSATAGFGMIGQVDHTLALV